MIINTDKDDVTEQSAWNKFEAKVRMHLYVLMHELTVNQVFTVLLYKILLLIEAAQFIWYAFHPRLTFLWDNGTMDVLRKIFKFSQVDQFLIDDGSSVLIPLLYIFCAFLVIMLVIAIINIKILSNNYQHRSSSSFLNYSLKILNAYNFLLTTILAFPFYFTFISVFACSSDNPVTSGLECYSGVFFLHWIVAFLSCIILFISSLALTFLSVDLNPWSKSPFASPKSRINLAKLAFKVIVSVYFVLDYQGNAKKVFIVIYAVLWLLILVLRFRQTPLYNRSIFNFTIGLETIIFWISLISVFEAFIDTTPAENIGLLYLGLGIIPLVFAVIKLFQYRRNSLFKVSPKTLKRDIEVELYILNIIELLDIRGNDSPQAYSDLTVQIDNIEQRMTLEGLLKLHIKTCYRPETECPCRAIAGNYYKDEAPEMLWYNWLKLQLIDGSNKFPKSARLHLLHAYMANYKLKNKYMALLQLIAAQKCKPSTEEQFTIYRCKKIIEQDMIDLDNLNNESKIDVNIIVEFQSRLIKFETAVEESVDLYQEFWSEVREISPEIHKLNSLGSKITSSVKIVALQYQKLEELNANQVKLLTMYGFYLKDIVNDDLQGDKVLEKAGQVAKNNKLEEQFLTKEQVKYGENSDTCLITCSGNPQTLGKMIRINNEITRLLKFSKQELTGRNVSHIMPRGLAELHDGFLRNYLQTSEEKTINKEMLTFPVNKAGYLVPCSLMVKVLPNLNAGIRFIGFLRELDEEREDEEDNNESGIQTRGFKTNTEEYERYYIMYDGKTGTIYGMTYGCKLTFGIPMSLINGEGGSGGGNNFNIDTIFPGLLQCSEQELKRPEGINIVLDTSTLRQNFFFAEDDEEDIDDEVYRKSENLKDLKFRQVDVNVRVVQDDKYSETHIRTIKFNESRYTDAPQEGITKVVKSQKKKIFKHNRTTSTKNEGGQDAAEPTPGRMIATAGEGQEEEEVEGGEPEGEEIAEKSSIENQQSSAFSSSQVEVNEEMKLIKDFKTFISSNKTPRLIIILRNSMLLLGVVLLGLITADLVLRLQQMGEYTDGVSYLSQDYQRHFLMGELNYNLRKLDLMAQDYLDIATADQATAQATFKTKVLSAVNQINEITLSINSQQDTLEDRGFAGVESDKVTVESLLQSGTKLDSRYFSDSMAQYTSHATSAANSDLTDFTSTDTKISTKADFYYVRRNGLGSLRVKSESNAEAFYDFYYDDIGNFDKKFVAIMIVAILITIISLFLLMMVVNSVHKTSTQVLSLFMYIPLSEIAELEGHCNNFKAKYLLDRKVSSNYSFSEEGLDSKNPSRLGKLKNGYQALNGEPMITEEISQDNMKASAVGGGDQELQTSPASKSFSTTQDLALSAIKYKNMLTKKIDTESVTGRFDTVTGRFDTTARFLKTEGDVIEESPVKRRIGEEESLHEETMMKDGGAKVIELNEDIIQLRSEKFRQSRDEYRLRVFLEFLFVGLIFVGYFVGDYADNRAKLNKLKVSLDHLKLLVERNANVRFIQTFTLELLAEGNDVDVNYYSYLLPYKGLRQHYITETLSNMKGLSNSRRESYSSAFSSYFSFYDRYTTGDLCSSYYSSDADCANIADGLLKQGLTIAITGIEQKSESIILAFNASAMAEQDQKDAINGDEFEKAENLLDYTLPVMEELRDKFISSFGDFIDKTTLMNRVKYGIFLAILLLVFFLMWLPYKAALMEKIFKTKGMLKMIPIELITKDENLKSVFFGGNILKAVK